MTTDPEDGWGDLARELGLDPLPRQNPPAATVQAAAPVGAEPEDADEAADPRFSSGDGQPDLFQDYEPEGEADADGSDLESDSDDGADNGSESDGGAGGASGDGEGPKKKRRRRRRRKKKGGEPAGDGLATETAEEDDGDEPEAMADTEDEDEESAEETTDDGGPTAEASRELIANWDVPSWEQIVAGLYRPGGR